MSDEPTPPSPEELRRRVDEARDAYERARDAERDARRTEWRAERQAHRAERREERQQRRHVRFGFGFDPGDFANGIVKDLVAGGMDFAGEEFSEPVSGRFTLSGMPFVRARNISGRTSIRVGADGEVVVAGRKYVRGSSADRAKRLLENVEVRMVQDGDEIRIEPHLYEQERSWVHLVRGGRVAVDLEITVPRETRLEAHTVSGELAISGTRGPADVHGVSGDVTIDDLQGPMRLQTVSGHANVRSFAGAVDANSVSGEVSFQASRLRGASVVTVSGDVELDGDLEGDEDHRIKTISGDVDLAISGPAYTIEFKSMSGDVDTRLEADVTRDGRRDKTVRIGSGGTRVRVKTVSGDLRIRRSGSSVPDAEQPSADESPTDEAPPNGGPAARDVLDRLARGELSVDDAAAALDDARRRAG